MHETSTIAGLVPPAAAVAEIVGPCTADMLLPEEHVALGEVSDDRRGEFALGRACARLALQKLGLGPLPILRGPNREPLWPPGICGSITHCDEHCAAVVARITDIRSIGIDAERIVDFADPSLERIALETERAWIKHADRKVPWPVLLFSAKESVFKAWFQVFGTGLDFNHVRIDFHQMGPAFRANASRTGPSAANATEFIGRFRFDGTHVQTSAFIPVLSTPKHSLEGYGEL